jgi:hypothetical protein
MEKGKEDPMLASIATDLTTRMKIVQEKIKTKFATSADGPSCPATEAKTDPTCARNVTKKLENISNQQAEHVQRKWENISCNLTPLRNAQRTWQDTFDEYLQEQQGAGHQYDMTVCEDCHETFVPDGLGSPRFCHLCNTDNWGRAEKLLPAEQLMWP